MILVPLFRFEIPEADSRHTVQEFQIGGTRSNRRKICPEFPRPAAGGVIWLKYEIAMLSFMRFANAVAQPSRPRAV